MGLVDVLKKAVEIGASDVFIIPGSAVMAKVNHDMVPLTEGMNFRETEAYIDEIYETAKRDKDNLIKNKDDDFAFALPGMSRFRVNTYWQRGSLAAICRIVNFELPDENALHIPPVVMNLVEQQMSGMIIVTGPTGSGKSTTLACLINRINSTRSGHIITIEDPIEYLYRYKKSIVSQREIPNDVLSFTQGLRAALREAPDVIMLGEMRDLETIRTAITAAETGHLLLSSLHTSGASKTVDRIIDTFPAEQQAQIRMQLSFILKAVISQHLVPALDGGRIAVFEVMTMIPAIQNMIRDGRTQQIDNTIYSNHGQSMLSMDMELINLVKQKLISKDTAVKYAVNPDTVLKRV